MRFVNLQNRVFGSLTVLARVFPNKNGDATWLCKCACGELVNVTTDKLNRGQKGCRKCSVYRTHGKSGIREYKIWNGMTQRATNPNDPNYEYYSGRGIGVCERWLKFENFFEDMGYAPSSKHTLERMENDKGYYKENCKWATMKEQSKNKRNNKVIEYNGDRKCLVDWCDVYGLEKKTLSSRLIKGWSVEAALTTPVKISRKGILFRKK